MGSTSDWLKICFNQSEALPLSVTRHQYGISTLVPQTSFGGKTSGSIAKCWLFSQAVICTGTEDLTEAFKNLSISTITTKTTSLFAREFTSHLLALFCMLHKLPNFYPVDHHGQQTAGTENNIYSSFSRKCQENFVICQKSLKHTDPKQTTGQPAYHR